MSLIFNTKILILLCLIFLFYATSTLSRNIETADTTKYIIHHISSASADSMCVVDIDYPELFELKNKFLQDTLNRFLKDAFVNEEEIDISNCDSEIGSTLEINCYIEYNHLNIISIVQYFYIFNGGAHGFYGHNGYNINVANGNLISLTDLIKKESFFQLSELSEKKLIEDYGVENFSDLGLFEESLNIPEDQDFYLTPDALVIEFDPYEIGPYVMGDIEIYIPWKELNGMLTNDFEIDN